MIKAAREWMREACGKPENAFSEAFYSEHVAVVRDVALRLAEPFGADPEVVELAAYLHDAAAVLDFTCLPRHPELGAERARAFLLERGYPAARVERVSAAILTHSSPLAPGHATPEQVCISQADAVSQLARPVYWLWYAFDARKMGFAGGREWYRQRVDSHWNALAPAARALAEELYRFDRALLEMNGRV